MAHGLWGFFFCRGKRRREGRYFIFLIRLLLFIISYLANSALFPPFPLPPSLFEAPWSWLLLFLLLLTRFPIGGILKREA